MSAEINVVVSWIFFHKENGLGERVYQISGFYRLGFGLGSEFDTEIHLYCDEYKKLGPHAIRLL